MLRMRLVPGGNSAVAHFSSTFFAQFHIITPPHKDSTSNLNHLPSARLFSSCWFLGMIPKPWGVIKQSSNLENHHSSAARSVTHTYGCTQAAGCDVPWWRCSPGWKEVSKTHQKYFPGTTSRQLFTTEAAIESRYLQLLPHTHITWCTAFQRRARAGG